MYSKAIYSRLLCCFVSLAPYASASMSLISCSFSQDFSPSNDPVESKPPYNQRLKGSKAQRLKGSKAQRLKGSKHPLLVGRIRGKFNSNSCRETVLAELLGLQESFDRMIERSESGFQNIMP